MKLKGMKNIGLLGIGVLMLMVSVAPQMAQAGEFSPPGECQDLGRSISLDVDTAGVEGSGARVMSRLELRSLANGLGVGEIETIKAYAIAKAEAKGLMQGMKARFAAEYMRGEYMSMVKCVPVLQAGEVIVAFGVVMGTDGVPSHFKGVACCPESVTVARRLAREWYKRELVRVRQLDPQASNPSGTSASQWIRVSFGHHVRPEFPYGVVGHSWELHRLVPDGCSRYNIYGVKHFTNMEPGRERWPTPYPTPENPWYENDFMRVTHTWHRDKELRAQLRQWGPLGSVAGRQTFHIMVSTKGPGFGWYYTQPDVSTVDRSSKDRSRARWDTDFHTSVARRSTGGTKPGSSAATWQAQPTGRWLRLVDIQVTGRFQRGSAGIHSPDVIVARWISVRYN